MTRFVYDANQNKVVPRCERTDKPRIHQIAPDWKPYESPMGDGLVIDGRRAAREHMARHGKRILEPGESAQAMREREQSLAELRRNLDPRDNYGYAEAAGGLELRFKR